jgi:hypothetical protein
MGCQQVLDDRNQLHFAPGPAVFYIYQHPFQIPNPSSQGPHLAQASLNLLQPVTYQLKGFS